MQYSPTISMLPSQPIGEQRPVLLSLDSGREFSLDHYVEVAWLVERQEDELEGYVFEDSLVAG